MRGAARAEASLLELCRVVTISLKAMRDKVPPMICRPDGANDIPAHLLPFGDVGGGALMVAIAKVEAKECND